MNLPRQTVFWVLALVALIAFVFVFRTILLPFVAGMALAYALDPIADWFERRGFSRLAATLTILILAILVFVAAALLIVPTLANQLADFIVYIPVYAEKLQGLFSSLLQSRLFRFLGVSTETIKESLGQILASGTTIVTSVLRSILTGGQVLLNVLSILVVTPVVAFYLLYDWDRMVAVVDGWLPRKHAETIRDLARQMDLMTAAFVRGQILVCVILGLIYAGGLMLVGVNFGFLIGVVAGLLSFIPYVGFTVGFVASVAVALVQFLPNWLPVLLTVAVFAVGQVIEGYVLQPRLIGKSVGLHPVWLLFALFAFGALFGFVGLLIAIPAAAAIGVLIRFGLAAYMASPIYRGTDDVPTGGP
jgi:predicted PurR-regulated permease PerM